MPVVGALPVVVGGGRYRPMVATGILGAPIAVAIAAAPTMLGPDVGPVYKVYALVVAACFLAAAQIDRQRLLPENSFDSPPDRLKGFHRNQSQSQNEA